MAPPVTGMRDTREDEVVGSVVRVFSAEEDVWDTLALTSALYSFLQMDEQKGERRIADEPNSIRIWGDRCPRRNGNESTAETGVDVGVEGAVADGNWGTMGLVRAKCGVYTAFEGLVPLASPAGRQKGEGDRGAAARASGGVGGG